MKPSLVGGHYFNLEEEGQASCHSHFHSCLARERATATVLPVTEVGKGTAILFSILAEWVP